MNDRLPIKIDAFEGEALSEGAKVINLARRAAAGCSRHHVQPTDAGRFLFEAIQCPRVGVDSRPAAFMALSTWPTKEPAKRSAWALSGLIHGAAAMLQFSTVTGLPASMQARIALFARVHAVTVSTICRISSSVINRLLFRKRPSSAESAPRGKRGRP